MKNFKCIEKEVDIAIFQDELREFRHFWSDRRGKRIPLHRETLSIFLRTAVQFPNEFIGDSERDRKTEFYSMFPSLTSFLENFAKRINGKLSRINIVALKPGGRVYPHVDAGIYYKNRNRYHLVLQSPNGSRMLCGGEQSIWREGELWWFNNKLEHEAFNESKTEERIHVIFDVRPLGFFGQILSLIMDRQHS